ncbi:MAG: endonuclease domain-containing protein [Patescibacteria group bacterium]
MKYLAPSEVRTQRSNLKYLDELRELGRKNRQNPTEAEYKIWKMILRNHKIKEKFLRQKPIGRYILDFYCSKLLLAIEIDGDSHDKKAYLDKSRDWYLDIRGIKTIRYTNGQVLNNINGVFSDLLDNIKQREKELVFSPFVSP